MTDQPGSPGTDPSAAAAPATSGDRRIVVGVDGSPAALAAARWALDEATLRGARLELLRAWELPPPTEYYTPVPAELEAAAEAELQAVRDALGPTATVVTSRTAPGRPADVLIEAARDADLLVVGSRGHGAVVGMLIGSVALHVVSGAAGAVAVVPAPRGG